MSASIGRLGRPAQDSATVLPDIGIGKLLRRAHMAFSRDFRRRLAERDMTFGEFVHLERLWHEDGLNQTELSRRVGIVTASSTQIIDKLERRGFILRKRDSRDRRNINVFLTAAGKALESELLACAKTTNRIARTGLSTADTLALFATMERIIRNLEGGAAEADDDARVAPRPRRRKRRARS